MDQLRVLSDIRQELRTIKAWVIFLGVVALLAAAATVLPVLNRLLNTGW
jgi:hypothetical protein